MATIDMVKTSPGGQSGTFTGPDVEGAIANGLEILGVSRQNATIEVLRRESEDYPEARVRITVGDTLLTSTPAQPSQSANVISDVAARGGADTILKRFLPNLSWAAIMVLLGLALAIWVLISRISQSTSYWVDETTPSLPVYTYDNGHIKLSLPAHQELAACGQDDTFMGSKEPGNKGKKKGYDNNMKSRYTLSWGLATGRPGVYLVKCEHK
jgi:hypothetical protein